MGEEPQSHHIQQQQQQSQLQHQHHISHQHQQHQYHPHAAIHQQGSHHSQQPGHHHPPPQDEKTGQPVQISPEELVHSQMMAISMNGHSSGPGLQQNHQQLHTMGGTGPIDGFEMPLDPNSGAVAASGHSGAPQGPVGFDSPYGGMNHHMVPHQHPPNVMPPYDQQQVSILSSILFSFEVNRHLHESPLVHHS